MKKNNLAELPRTERSVSFTLCQRFLLFALLGRQTSETFRKVFARDLSEDEVVALYSIRRKVRTTSEDISQFSRRIGMDTRLDVDGLLSAPQTVSLTVTLDSTEARLLKSFLSGWLKAEGALADWDWADGLIRSCD